MNPDDVDSEILALVEGIIPPGLVRDSVVCAFQKLQDDAVSLALQENESDLAESRAKVAQLSASLSAQAKKLALTHVAHNNKVELLHEIEAKLSQLLESRNPFVRYVARSFRTTKGVDVRRLDYKIAIDALAERDLQDTRWGAGRHMPNGTGSRKNVLAMKEAQAATDAAFAAGNGTWLHILMEEVMEVAAESNPKHLKEELRQVIAVCIAWMIDLLTQKAKEPRVRDRAPKVLRVSKSAVDNRRTEG